MASKTPRPARAAESRDTATNRITKQASEIMKLNFMTDHGSNRDTIRWAWRALVPSPLRDFLGFLATCCGRGIRDVAACQADGRSSVRSAGRSVRVVSAGEVAGDAPPPGAGRDRGSSVCVRDAFTWAGYGAWSR